MNKRRSLPFAALRAGALLGMTFGAVAACTRSKPGGDTTVTVVATTADSAPPAAPRDTPVRTVSKTSPPPSQTRATGDWIIGTVDEHGADPMTFLAITPKGGPQTRLSGPRSAALGSIKNAEVWVKGAREKDNSFRVDTFEVRQVNGQAVHDGIVITADNGLAVRTSGGVVKIPDAPSVMQSVLGKRIWVTHHVAGVAPSYGVIQPGR